MFAKVWSLAVQGIEGVSIEVEVDLVAKVPRFVIVGLPDTAVREAKYRVKTAMVNSGLAFPYKRITINLAPADLKKQGPQYDLPIALGLLAADGKIDPEKLNQVAVIGELALDGTVRPIRGILSMVEAAHRLGKKGLICPEANAQEAALAQTLSVYPVTTIHQAFEILNQPDWPAGFSLASLNNPPASESNQLDYHEVYGQEVAKRAMLIAAAGRHNCLLVGTPGTGKSMLASRLPTILPKLETQQAIETTKIYSVAGCLFSGSLIATPPFRAPHHTTSETALTGGGSFPKPGEISLAHNGVLFLDELPEYSRRSLETLRQPVEDKVIRIARTQSQVCYPADFLLVAAMNPCPCGFLGDKNKVCRCSALHIDRYRQKISGPLLDRFDLQVEVPRIRYQDLLGQTRTSNSKTMRETVQQAREMQQQRLAPYGKKTNSEMTPSQVRKYCKLCQEGNRTLKQAMETMHLSARSHQRILKTSRTIADLEQQTDIALSHLLEALQYRFFDRL